MFNKVLNTSLSFVINNTCLNSRTKYGADIKVEPETKNIRRNMAMSKRSNKDVMKVIHYSTELIC